MTVLIVIAYGLAALFAGLGWRARLRRLRIAARPVLAVADLATTTPGTAVVVAGHTAPGPPPLKGPWSGVPCVWWEGTHTELVNHSSERFDLVTHTKRAGDPHLYDDTGTQVEITSALGGLPLLPARLPMMRAAYHREKRTGDQWGERVIEAETAVVVAGVVDVPDANPLLGHATWVDGTARAPLEELPRRLLRAQRELLAPALLFTVSAVVLTIIAART